MAACAMLRLHGEGFAQMRQKSMMVDLKPDLSRQIEEPAWRLSLGLKAHRVESIAEGTGTAVFGFRFRTRSLGLGCTGIVLFPLFHHGVAISCLARK